MGKSFSIFSPLALLALSLILLSPVLLDPLPIAEARTSGPQAASTSKVPDISSFIAEIIPAAGDHPSRIEIPSLDVDAVIRYVGVNDKGEMDVPSGEREVGWYKYGTIPGKRGTAVLDAHVYMAFAKLRDLKDGGDIFITTEGGEKLHFVVGDSRIYSLSEITPQILFAEDGARRINLITCAGKPVGDTYTHRLVVSAVLVNS